MICFFFENFFFGVVMVVYQIEGVVFVDGCIVLIWDVFVWVFGVVIGGDDGDVVCDYYYWYLQDVVFMKEFGLQMYCFLILWLWVCFDGGVVNVVGVDFYQCLVDEFFVVDIFFWLMLYYWDMLQVLQEWGGWMDCDMVDCFFEYVGIMYDVFGDWVNVWIMLNELWCLLFFFYIGGEYVFGYISIVEGLFVLYYLLFVYGVIVQELCGCDVFFNFGIMLNYMVVDFVDLQNLVDIDVVWCVDGQFNCWFFDLIYCGSYLVDIVEDICVVDVDVVVWFEVVVYDGDFELILQYIDIQGVNYYYGDFVFGMVLVDVFVLGGFVIVCFVWSLYLLNEGIYVVE